MHYSRSAQDALLKWVKIGFHLSQSVNSLEDLADGIVLSQVLQDLDPSYDAADIEQDPAEATRWLTKKRNLQSLYKALFKYIHRECPELDRLSKLADFRAIAENPDVEGICQLLSVMMTAAFLGPEPAKYVGRLQEPGRFDSSTMREIQHIIVTTDGAAKKAEERSETDDALEQVIETRDADLAFEEERASLLSRLDQSKKAHADTITRLEHLQDSYESLKIEEGKLQRMLETLSKASQKGASDSQFIKSLEGKIKEQEDLIANQEAQAEDDRVTKTRLQKDVTQLSQKARHAEQLDDEVKELRHRNEELSRKANAAERYKQKLEAQQNIATELDNLQYENQRLEESLRDYNKIVQRNQVLERTLAEVTKSLAAAEEDIFELSKQKKALEEVIRALQQNETILKERRSHDEKYISELQEQINSGTEASLASPGTTSGAFNLEQELEGARSVTSPNLALKISRLEAENEFLKTSMGSGPDTAAIREKAQDLERQLSQVAKESESLFNENTTIKSQLSALITNSTDPGDEILKNLKKKSDQLEHDYDAMKRKASDMEAEIADKDRDLLDAKTDLEAVGKDSIEALNLLKATDQLTSHSLRVQLDDSARRIRDLEKGLELKREHLIQALLEKEKYRKDAEDAKTLQDRVSSPPSTKKDDDTKEALRERLKVRNKQLEKAELEKHELLRRLKAAQEGGASTAQTATADQTIKNLQRENALISTAWYDLTSRIQSNHVVLQRRHDMPKSWLSKQRQLVNATPRR